VGFFEDQLSAVGRGMDACVEWCADRWRSVNDRARHAPSFEAVRERMERAADAARSGAERAAEEAKERWRRRDPVDRDAAKRVFVLAGVILVLAGVWFGVRVFTRERTDPISAAELEMMRRLREAGARDGSVPAPGLEGWTAEP